MMLETLYLSCNSIGEAGANALAEGLQHCKNLQTLNLSWNSIGDAGAKVLAEGLQQLQEFACTVKLLLNCGRECLCTRPYSKAGSNIRALSVLWMECGDYKLEEVPPNADSKDIGMIQYHSCAVLTH